jgi:glycosyltransferase involved in cell wall biosynthesis
MRRSHAVPHTHPLVSVVIPVFNGAPFVAAAVASVRNQTVRDVEILVVDDGSTDGTQSVLAGLVSSHGITWFQQHHGGPARSRNKGIESARGEFVALLDCDDVWLPDKLEAQLAVMRARPAVGLVHTDFDIFNEHGTLLDRVRARYSAEPMVQAFAGGHTALPSTLLIRHEVLKKVGALNPALYGSEDSDLTIRLYAVSEFECVERPLVRKLQRGHGYRDMAFDEATHRDKVLSSRELFLNGLERMRPLNAAQRAALDREWANYYLSRGYAAERQHRSVDARAYYRQAIKKAPFRLRGYTRWLRTLGSI